MIGRLFFLKMGFFVSSIILIIPSNCFSKVETIYVSHEYIMGDNDSKNDTRRMCFLEAKQKALERAGTYIENLSEVRNGRLTKDEITAYSAALLKVEIVKENWKLVGQNMTVSMTVKAKVDTNRIKKELAKIEKDPSVQKKIKAQHNRLKQLERKVVELERHLGQVNASKAATLRKDRNVIFKQIDALEAKKIAITSKIKITTKNVIKLVEKGMTKNEVRSLVGEPRGKAAYPYTKKAWNYGNVWIIFQSESVVGCIVHAGCFDAHLECTGYNPFSVYSKNCFAK